MGNTAFRQAAGLGCSIFFAVMQDNVLRFRAQVRTRCFPMLAGMKKSENFTLRMTPELRTALAAAKERTDRSESWLVCKWIEEGLQRLNQPKPKRRRK